MEMLSSRGGSGWLLPVAKGCFESDVALGPIAEAWFKAGSRGCAICPGLLPGAPLLSHEDGDMCPNSLWPALPFPLFTVYHASGLVSAYCYFVGCCGGWDGL